MTCTNATCPVFIICQKKHNPPEQCLKTPIRIIHNGYAAMAMQEQIVRASAIEFSGNWEG